MKNKWFNKNLINTEDNDFGFLNENLDFWNDVLNNPCDSTSREKARNALRNHYKGYHGYEITDSPINVLCQMSLVPSAYITWAGDKAVRTHENGIPVDYKELYGNLRKLYCDLNIDLVDVFIETMREGGIRPWVSLRMNDAHCFDEETNFLRGDFFYESIEKGLTISSNGTDYGYFYRCMDYAQPRVKNMMLNYIREIAERYDMDGLELDFQRELFCFDYKNNRDCHKIMSDFMREARRIVNEAAEKKGHDVLLMARVSPSIEDSLAFGFDVKTWAEENLIDAIVPAPRWAYCDSGIPVEDWKKLVGEDIAVFAGIETLNRDFTYTTVEQAKAYWAGFDAAGADGILLFNMYIPCEKWTTEHAMKRNRGVWNLTPEKCLDGARDFTVLGQDIASGLVPVYDPLPLVISDESTLTLVVGSIKPENKLTLTIDFEGDKIPEISINGINSTNIREIPAIIGNHCETDLPSVQISHYKPLEYILTNVFTEKKIDIKFSGNGAVHYVNLRIE